MIANTAVRRLPSAIAAQDKRLYYMNRERSTKVWLDETQLLQQLVFASSDRIERSDESRRAPEAGELLIRYLKHLVWISTRRNAFHVAIAVARLLYGYTTPETAEIYCRLADDPEKIADDAYYRARKRFLVQEIHERFPRAIRVDGGTIAGVRAAGETRTLVEQSLEAFAPWEIPCDAAIRGELPLMHVFLHPRCFRERVMALAWPDPSPRLQVPAFETVMPHIGARAARPLDRERLALGGGTPPLQRPGRPRSGATAAGGRARRARPNSGAARDQDSVR